MIVGLSSEEENGYQKENKLEQSASFKYDFDSKIYLIHRIFLRMFGLQG